jgi:hypothetical protein
MVALAIWLAVALRSAAPPIVPGRDGTALTEPMSASEGGAS